MSRNVIFHYHLFKNAGTSVDELLKQNFRGHWVTEEFNGNHANNNLKVKGWVERESKAVVFSSHTAALPPPVIENMTVFPIIFVRHPIDRIASAYAFERKQGGDSFGAVLARNTSLGGYIEIRLSLGRDRQCNNFHVARLAQMYYGQAGDETEFALKAVDELPFVGLVEEFDKSIKCLAHWLTPYFPDFNVLAPKAKNVSQDHTIPLADRLAKIKQELGDSLYAHLIQINSGDFAIYEAVREKLEQSQKTA